MYSFLQSYNILTVSRHHSVFLIRMSSLGSRGTRGSQADSHNTSSSYHDNWESRSSYPDRDRYENREHARDSSFERRHSERDKRDNRDRGLPYLIFSVLLIQQLDVYLLKRCCCFISISQN